MKIRKRFQIQITEEQYKILYEILLYGKVRNEIIFYKSIFNRAHPAQIAPEKLNVPKSTTADTPCFLFCYFYNLLM